MSDHEVEAWDDLLFGRGHELDGDDGDGNYTRGPRGRYTLRCKHCKSTDVYWRDGVLTDLFTVRAHRCGFDNVADGFDDETV